MKVLVVGQNPSRHNTDPSLPFIGSMSGEVLTQWLKELNILETGESFIVNAFNEVNQEYKPNDILEASKRMVDTVKKVSPERIIALGSRASRVLTKARIDHFMLPHPSGKNRKLNNKDFIINELSKAKRYLE